MSALTRNVPRSIHCLVLALCAMSAASAHAQSIDVRPGARVQLRWPDGRDALTASYVRGYADTIWVQYAGSADTVAVPSARLKELRVYRGQGHAIGRRMLRGFLTGAAIGGALGLGLALGNREDADFFGGVAGTAAFFAGLVSVPGALIGALAGISYEVWDPVPLRNPSPR